MTKEIIRQNGVGLKGLNKGITATVCRNGTFNTIYFGFYHSVKEFFPAYEVKRLIISLIDRYLYLTLILYRIQLMNSFEKWLLEVYLVYSVL